jgi:hypothetical protein
MILREATTMAEKTVMFEYLDGLRESGVCNMFGARPYLQEAFNLPKNEASAILSEWMATFGQRHHKEAKS